MIFSGYFDKVGEGIEFLIAVGSIIGLLGLIVAIMAILILPKRQKTSMILVIVISCILVFICGMDTGLRYFHIYI